MDTRRRLRRLITLVGVLLLAVATIGGGGPAVAAQAPAGQRPSGHGWAWPLEPRPAVVRQFEAPERPWLSGHRGVDLGTARGAPIRAPQVGTVVFSGWVVDRPVVTIDHGDGLRSSFEPVVGTLPVGAAVAKGQELGTLAAYESGHCSPADCLHWGVRAGDEYVDPLAFIEDRRPSVLLPWSGPP